MAEDKPNYLNDDAECVQRALRNEINAYQVLYERYKLRIYRYIWLRIENKADARDLTARTFHNAFAKLKKLKKPQYFRQWLFKIAINEIRMYRRSLASTIKTTSIEELPKQALKDNPGVSAVTESVIWTMNQLTQPEQDILNYRLIQKRDIDEIAQTMGISKQMAYYLLRKATKKFAEIYQSKYKLAPDRKEGEKNETW